jgi:hypothetical protein
MMQRCVWSGWLRCVRGLLLVGTAIFASAIVSRADFNGAHQLPNQIYSFPPNAFVPLNEDGRFDPPDPEMRFRPIAAAAVPGMPNTLAVARHFGGVDLVNATDGSLIRKALQIPIAPYPNFAPSFNMVPNPSNPNDPNDLVQGELYVQGESGLLGVAFHPNFAQNRKFYVSLTVQNPNAPLINIPEIDPTDGLHETELNRLNDPNDPAGIALRQCFICDELNNAPRVVGRDNEPDGDVDGWWGVECPDGFGDWAWWKVHAKRPTLMQVREYTLPEGNDQVDPTDYRTVLSFERRFDYHNGGWLGFGPNDNMLYLTSGDSQGTPAEGTVLDLGDSKPEDPAHDFFGKVLRMDVSDMTIDNPPLEDGTIQNFTIPSDNPFAAGGAKPTPTPDDDAIWAYGLRNPWRASFDAVTADMWIGDVGFSTAEEVNLIKAGSGALENNFGWPRFEGTFEHTSAQPAAEPPVPPEHFYSTAPPNERGSIIGGFVYRGTDPTLQGKYIYYESNRRQVWSYDPNEPNPNLRAKDISHKVFDDDVAPFGEGNADLVLNGLELVPVIDNKLVGLFAAFGQDDEGNLYLISYTGGEIYRIDTTDPDPETILSGPGKRGDANSDGVVDENDIDLWAAAAQPGANPPLAIYDLNSPPDGMVTFGPSGSATPSDSDVLIHDLVDIFDEEGIKIGNGSAYGDADLDGLVFLSDLNALASNYKKSGKFGWADGNFNGSQESATSGGQQVFLADLNLLAINWRDGMGSGAATGAVPEPTSGLLLIWAFAFGICRYPSRRRKPI